MNAGEKEQAPTIHERVLAVLEGRKPDRIPFIDRMDFWYRGLRYQDNLPEPFRELSLTEIHQAIGFGQEDWLNPCAFKFHNLELVTEFEGREILHDYEPEISYFPDLWGMIPVERAGEATTVLITPVGKLTYQHRILEESLRAGTTRPQLTVKPVREPEDYRVYEYILDQAEFLPHFEAFFEREAALGGNGYLVPMLNRVPFQSLLIDVIGEIPFFYALHDYPQLVSRLLQVIDEQIVDMLERLSGFQVPYIEFCDNLEGSMTNPRLFEKYVGPSYQRYSQILQAQGKKLGSHTDGDLKNLVRLLPGSGLDVCESFTPAPITACTFEEAWTAWENGPLIWGGIPSYYLEERLPEPEFHERIEILLALVRDRPIILGIGDAVMSDNEIERLRWIAGRIENTPI